MRSSGAFQPKPPKHGCEACAHLSICRHRGKRLTTRKRMARGPAPERKVRMPTRQTRLNPVNPERAAKKFRRNYHSPERVAWVNAKCCAYCGADDDTIRNDHVTKRGAGGAGGDYTRILPACHVCDTIRENRGLRVLLKLRGLTMADVEWKLAALNREWREYCERGARTGEVRGG